MKLLDLTLPTPAENLACDEALLDLGEAGQGLELLRFWEPTTHFVVVGHANRVAAEVHLGACEAGNIPILRRCSGGGAVLQGPGCLNYTLILRIAEDGPLGAIGTANRFIMERNRAALADLAFPSEIEVRGHTDLAIRGLKFSGNAQRRKKRFLLFHGTFLLQFDLSLVEKLLPLPSRQPEYRGNRTHRDFLANFPAPRAAVKLALEKAWNAFDPLEPFPRDPIALLSRDKYATTAWNFKF